MDEVAKSKRLSNRTKVLIAVGVPLAAAVPFVVWGQHKRAAKKAAVTELEKRRVSYQEQRGHFPTTIRRPLWLAIPFARLRNRYLDRLIGPTCTVSFSRRDVEAPDYALLHDLPPVTTLLLQEQTIGETELKHIGRLQALENLDFSITNVSDRDLRHVSSLRNLTALDLSLTPITGTGLEYLASLEQLTSLSLFGTKVTDDNLRWVSNLSALKNLDLRRTEIGDSGMVHVSALSELEDLALNFTKVTDVGVQHIAKLTNLTRLYMVDTGVSDASIPVLIDLYMLRHLSLVGTKVTSSGFAAFQEARPDVSVAWLPPGTPRGGEE